MAVFQEIICCISRHLPISFTIHSQLDRTLNVNVGIALCLQPVSVSAHSNPLRMRCILLLSTSPPLFPPAWRSTEPCWRRQQLLRNALVDLYRRIHDPVRPALDFGVELGPKETLHAAVKSETTSEVRAQAL